MKKDRPPRILVIEDHHDMQLILKRYLEEQEYTVEIEDNAESGIRSYQQNRPDIVLMDIMLPGMSGIEATKELRRKYKNDAIYTPILILTAKSDVKDIVLGLDIGADDYIVKPFHFDELSARINSALRLKNLNELLVKQAREIEEANLKIHKLNLSLVDKNKELRKGLFGMHNLFEISMELNSILELNRLVNSTLLTLVGQFSSKNALFLLLNKDNKDIFEVMNSKGYDLERRLQKSTALKKIKKLNTEIVAPVAVKEFVQGLICMGPRVKNQEYSKQDFEHISILSNIISIAVSNAALYEEIEQLSYTDGMTDLHNYRYFELRLKEEVLRHKRTNSPLSLLILDVDNFKNFNDTMGHPAGDQVLRNLANILKETVRENDIVARYGGEEFAVIIPAVDRKGAAILAERIRKKVEKTYFEHEEIQPLGKVTVSVGGASAPEDAQTYKDLMMRADTALYAAKKGGRNQLRMFEEGMSK
jgi:two-component system cell cycle response regulator